ncbi:MAG: undecaprenyl-diphosphate phosphatase [candidate division Zixibacteria bacterium]|nr:undecaprenyl-diphosphate phosphatase [candidate division Zixibacteria bacterium]
MTYYEAILLGIIQGLTEFLPVSSSGHLVLTQELLHVNQPGLVFELLAHVGTLGAVLVYFRKSVWRLIRALFPGGGEDDRRMILWIIIGTIPAGLVGLFLEDWFDQAFSSPALTAAMLLVTGLILMTTRLVKLGSVAVGWKSSLIMGLGQAMAIMPGISRSGTTIAAGLLAKVKPDHAAEFSFLLAIPAIGGAVVLKAGDLIELQSDLLGPYLVGALMAFLFGLVAVHFVLSVIRRGKFDYFAYYCFAAGGLGLYLFL